MTIFDLTDLSSPEPVVEWSEQWWAQAKPEVRAHRCKAHRKNGDRCKRVAIDGANVCPQHGGRAPQVRAKAQRRFAEATDHMARELLKMATDDNVADSVKLTAIRDALDRGGVVAKTSVEVGVSVKPFEAILDKMDSGSRAEFLRSMGIEEPEEPEQMSISIGVPPCEYDEDDLIVDGEVVDAENDELIYNDKSEPFRTRRLRTCLRQRLSGLRRAAGCQRAIGQWCHAVGRCCSRTG